MAAGYLWPCWVQMASLYLMVEGGQGLGLCTSPGAETQGRVARGRVRKRRLQLLGPARGTHILTCALDPQVRAHQLVLPPCDVVIKAVADYVRNIQDPSDLDAVAKDVFQHSQV